MRVEIRSTVRDVAFPAGRARNFLPRALALAQRRAAEVSVLFCGDRRMQRLNRVFRAKNRTTDVLSFPAGDGGGFLGDIVISIPQARRQAVQEGMDLDGMMRKLLLHGLLHLLGYDHETDNGEMDAVETRLRRRLSIPS